MTKASALKEVKKYGMGGVVGRQSIERYLSGETIHRKGAIFAKCYECFGYCADGRPTCEDESCALWPFSQFNKSTSDDLKEGAE
jgi:hypothetical protein